MAFLQLKKQYHMDKAIIVKLAQSPMDVIGKTNKFENIQFTIKAINKGSEYACSPMPDKDPFIIRVGQEFDFTMSETLFGKINDFEKDELVYIKMTTGGKGMVWNVKAANQDDIKGLTSHISNTGSNQSSTEKNMEIKWGMAFNNATRLIAQTTSSTDPKDMVGEIKRVIAPMFQIACGMEKTIKFINNGMKKVVEKPVEEKTKEELEDELF